MLVPMSSSDPTSPVESASAAKRAQRLSLRQRRAARSPAAQVAAGAALVDVALGVPEVAAAGVVAAYVGIGTEPPTLPLLERLQADGVRVLLPIVTGGRTLDWAVFTGPAGLAVVGPVGFREPTGPRLGPGGLAAAAVVLVPALAVDRRGCRLGTGGGYYDRALAAGSPETTTLAVVYDDEVLDRVASEPHDRRVSGALTPSGRLRFAAG
jgi:5-formyltetrahydrofolate cyclo-ligase